MKKIKKLLFTLAALTLVFCSLSSVMTVSALNANQKLCKKAISSITLTLFVKVVVSKSSKFFCAYNLTRIGAQV